MEYTDPIIAFNGSSLKASEAVCELRELSVDTYHQMLDNGVSREQARGILPQNLYTVYWGTVNLNNLFKFISLRNKPDAQWEIQVVAKACLEIALDLWPITVGSYIKCFDGKLGI